MLRDNGSTFVEIASGALVVCRDLRVMDEDEDGASSAAPSMCTLL